ncbi:hypothetical protein EUX98_g938 [Antrodiella citrinella]|uniref:Glycosyltransferase family 15 protein n=1 Tax=Antrodiella citrinella TaxID=2447956 RepID=A0A4S4N5Z5_9APHY|nr:hypothetical protein EUX98_g938 [Antrodiella citrinella]
MPVKLQMSRPLLLVIGLASIAILGTMYLREDTSSQFSLITSGVIDSIAPNVVLEAPNEHASADDMNDMEYWRTGKFIGSHLDTHPSFNVHDAPVNHIPVDQLGYNAAVLYLISDNRLRETMLSLSYLYRWVPMHPWPIILFHASDMDDPAARNDFMLRLYDFLGGGDQARLFIQRIEWVRLHWMLPNSFSHDVNVVKPVFEFAWPGYHMMCAFFASEVFDHPRLQNVTYYMRLDTDSYIFRPLCYDPFEIFHQRKRSYGYRAALTDPAEFVVGLWDLTDEYAKTHVEVEERMQRNGFSWPSPRERGSMGEREYPGYYNNFEIVRLEAFRTPEVRAWLDEVKRVPERIYKYRWGDSPIRYATVYMFMDIEKDVEEYCGMDYWHQGTYGKQCLCEDQKNGRS